MKNKLPVSLLAAFIFIAGCGNKSNQQQPASSTETNDTVKTIIHNHNYASNVYSTVDVSPMDMSYYPVEYYKMNMARRTTTPLVVRVIYSRPHLNGRALFKDVLQFGEPWRMGANESTEIQFFRDVTIQNKKIKTGRYILYCIPGEKSWTIIFNTNLDTWGLQQDAAKDLFRFDAPAAIMDHHTEYFTIVFEKTDHGANMVMAWGNYEIKLPIDFSFE